MQIGPVSIDLYYIFLISSPRKELYYHILLVKRIMKSAENPVDYKAFERFTTSIKIAQERNKLFCQSGNTPYARGITLMPALSAPSVEPSPHARGITLMPALSAPSVEPSPHARGITLIPAFSASSVEPSPHARGITLMTAFSASSVEPSPHTQGITLSPTSSASTVETSP